VQENGKTYSVLIANMGSINPGVKLVDNPKYPGIASDYARTFRVQKALACDVFVAAHASHYGLHEKLKASAGYNPERFVDPAGYKRAVQEFESRYLKQIEQEQASRAPSTQ
ncbi:MAG: subclass B3 metallo-beta-lactamase, partial [Bryobacteraceae bacterium]